MATSGGMLHEFYNTFQEANKAKSRRTTVLVQNGSKGKKANQVDRLTMQYATT